MEYQLADSHTGQPFKIKRAPKKAQEAEQASLLKRFFQRLGWKQKPEEPTEPMKEVTMLVPCIAGGKPRKKGEAVILPDLKAAELISMKVATLKQDLPNAKIQPWEKPRAKAPAKQETVPALK